MTTTTEQPNSDFDPAEWTCELIPSPTADLEALTANQVVCAGTGNGNHLRITYLGDRPKWRVILTPERTGLIPGYPDMTPIRDDVDPETGELLAEYGIKPGFGIIDEDGLFSTLRKVRSMERAATDIKAVNKVEATKAKRLEDTAAYILNTHETEILALVEGAFKHPREHRGMTAKQWAVGPMTLSIKDIPDTFDVTDELMLKLYAKSYRRDVLRMSVSVPDNALADNWPDDGFITSHHLLFHLVKEQIAVASLTVDTAALFERLVYIVDTATDEEGNSTPTGMTFIIDTVTGEDVKDFIHCTPGTKNGKVGYIRPKSDK